MNRIVICMPSTFQCILRLFFNFLILLSKYLFGQKNIYFFVNCMQKPNSIRKLLGLHFYLDIPTFILCISFRYLFLTHTKHQTMSAVNNNNNNDYNNDEKLTVIMTWCYYQKIIFPVTTTISYVVGVIIYIFKNLFTVIWKNTYSWAESRPEKN